MTKRYKIEVTEKQARLISRALDIVSRLEAGQFEELIYRFEWPYAGKRYRESCDTTLEILKYQLTGMSTNGNLGITMVSNDSRMSYDMHQVIRHRLAWDGSPLGGMSVDLHEPMKYGDENLATIEEIT